MDVDQELLASQLIRSLRGKRSQTALSRRLGYKSNVVYTWEAGDGYPTAAKFFYMARRLGKDPAQAVQSFYRQPAPWLDGCSLESAEGVARLLRELRGRTPITLLAERTGRDRFAVSRWLKGTTEPRLPDFLRMVQACSLRLIDFLSELVDPAELPEVAEEWESLQVARRAAYEAPWSHAVLRVLETVRYQKLPKHRPGFIAKLLGIPLEEEERCLELLSRTDQIRFDGTHWREHKVLMVDLRKDPEASRKVLRFWMQVGMDRVGLGKQGRFAYNLIGVSNADLERLRELQSSYFAQLRSIVAESEPVEQVVLVNMQLLPFDGVPE